MVRRRWLSLIFLAGLAAPAAAALKPSRSDGARLKRLERQYKTLQKTLGIPGLSVGVARGGKILWTKGFGWADVPRRVPARPDTLYRAASLTKTMTAVVALQMVEEGALSLDRLVPLEDGRVVPFWSLLSHTWMNAPGETFVYSDRGFALAATVMEVLSGKPYKELVQKRVVERAGLGAVAGEDDPTLPALSRLASFYAYAPTKGQYGPAGKISRFNAASGMLVSVEDLLRYSRALDEGRLLKPETRELLWAPRRAPDGTFHPYGLGWFTGKFDGRAVVWHYGFVLDGGSALLLKVPEMDLTLAILANSDGLSAPFQPALLAGLATASPFAADFLRIFVEEPFEKKKWPDPDWARGAAGAPPLAPGHDFDAERLAGALIDAWRRGSILCVALSPVTDPAADRPDPHPTLCACGEPKKSANP